MKDNEIMVYLDIKEMSNSIDTHVLTGIINMNNGSTVFNRRIVMDMIAYDLKEANFIIWEKNNINRKE